MPHLHNDENADNNDDASSSSESPSSCKVNEADAGNSPCKEQMSAANKLLSLAALAEVHGNAIADDVIKEENSNNSTSREAHSSSPSPTLATRRPSYEEERRHGRPPMPPGMWGMPGHPAARYSLGYYHPPAFMHNPMYHSPLMAVRPGHRNSEPGDNLDHAARQVGEGPGYPMWAAAPPRPPYYPCMHPSQLPPVFRGHMPPAFLSRQSSAASANAEENATSGTKRSVPKRVSLGSTSNKSISKKPRIETSSSIPASKVNDSRLTMVEATGEDKNANRNRLNEENQTREVTFESVTKKGSIPSQDASTEKQMIISPASSNECPKGEEDKGERALSPSQRNTSYESVSPRDSPYMQAYPSPGLAGPDVYHRRALPFARTGGHPGTYYPATPNMSARGRSRYAGMAPYHVGRSRMTATPSPAPSSPAEQQTGGCNVEAKAPETATSSAGADAPKKRPPVVRSSSDILRNPSQATPRCIPLGPNVISKHWSNGTDASMNVNLPDFHRLVNFPELLAKGRNSGVEADCGTKQCVMCGKRRLSAGSARTNMGKAAAKCSAGGTGDDDDDGANQIIPRQNKGVCTACDITVWVAVEMDGLEIKWCKGCKNFRPWSAFGTKGSATKCVRCRDRQKEKYATQKKKANKHCVSDEVEEKKATTGEEALNHHGYCGLTIAAADGLRNLMNAAR